MLLVSLGKTIASGVAFYGVVKVLEQTQILEQVTAAVVNGADKLLTRFAELSVELQNANRSKEQEPTGV